MDRILVCGVVALLLAGLAVVGRTARPADVDARFRAAPRTEVLLLGTFHFKDAGLDSYTPQFDVDITVPHRQAELAALLDKLGTFAPQAIGLEFMPAAAETIQQKYDGYRNGEFVLPANEVYQIGFRLAARLGHGRVFGVDAEARHYEDILNRLLKEGEATEQMYTTRLREFAPRTRSWTPLYRELYQYQDHFKTEVSLLEFFRYLNRPDVVDRSHGTYLVDTFKFGLGQENDYFGADFRTAWYNRNLRILHNIYGMIAVSDARRVLVVMGAGHLPILRHAVRCSPELDLVDTMAVLE